MGLSAPPLFLARRSYRRRRLIDAARLLPVVGAVLICLPALWHPASSPEPDTTRGLIYLFAVWFGLILAAAALAWALGRAIDVEDEAEGAGRDGGDG